MYKSVSDNFNELHIDNSKNYTTLILCIEVRSDCYNGVYELSVFEDEYPTLCHTSYSVFGERSFNDIIIPIKKKNTNISCFLTSNITYSHINRLNDDSTLSYEMRPMPGIISYKLI